MHIKYNLGETEVLVNCWVDLEKGEVTLVMYQDTNIVDCLELDTLNKITEAAQQKFIEDMNEP